MITHNDISINGNIIISLMIYHYDICPMDDNHG